MHTTSLMRYLTGGGSGGILNVAQASEGARGTCPKPSRTRLGRELDHGPFSPPPTS